MDYLQYWRYGKLHRRNKFWVLNLIINGLPSIPDKEYQERDEIADVLNLIINGLPSILILYTFTYISYNGF